ncbi:MAG: hypothetical protein K0U54_07620 [Bacteroidetes bacterium]|nr:hypothetical protein [Bacteroidota bacterium]
MFRLLGISLLLLVALACKSDDDNINNRNPFLVTPPVSLSLNLNLPQYNPLQFPGSSVVISSQGIRGIIVYNVNNDLYTAFDLSDPNHVPSGCSQMEVEGIIATCPCSNDENSYDIVTGQHQSNPDSYPMLQYVIQRNGETITVSN